LLGEGIARTSGDIDVVWVNGYGWPAWTGGPMFHAAQTGYKQVVARLEALGYEPDSMLLKMAAAQG
jgi:3-hydroxyacyl-CoA dehydrogenase